MLCLKELHQDFPFQAILVPCATQDLLTLKVCTFCIEKHPESTLTAEESSKAVLLSTWHEARSSHDNKSIACMAISSAKQLWLPADGKCPRHVRADISPYMMSSVSQSASMIAHGTYEPSQTLSLTYPALYVGQGQFNMCSATLHNNPLPI